MATNGNAPLVGQLVYVREYAVSLNARKYIVNRIDRSIGSRTINTDNIKVQNSDPEKQLDELIKFVTETYECYVDEIRGSEMKIATDEAQINLVPWSMPVDNEE